MYPSFTQCKNADKQKVIELKRSPKTSKHGYCSFLVNYNSETSLNDFSSDGYNLKGLNNQKIIRTSYNKKKTEGFETNQVSVEEVKSGKQKKSDYKANSFCLQKRKESKNISNKMVNIFGIKNGKASKIQPQDNNQLKSLNSTQDLEKQWYHLSAKIDASRFGESSSSSFIPINTDSTLLLQCDSSFIDILQPKDLKKTLKIQDRKMLQELIQKSEETEDEIFEESIDFKNPPISKIDFTLSTQKYTKNSKLYCLEEENEQSIETNKRNSKPRYDNDLNSREGKQNRLSKTFVL